MITIVHNLKFKFNHQVISLLRMFVCISVLFKFSNGVSPDKNVTIS